MGEEGDEPFLLLDKSVDRGSPAVKEISDGTLKFNGRKGNPYASKMSETKPVTLFIPDHTSKVRILTLKVVAQESGVQVRFIWNQSRE